MTSYFYPNVRKFKRQSEFLILLIQAQGSKQWPKDTVIIDKGQLVSVGGSFMPANPPAFIRLTDDEMIAFKTGKIKNLGDLMKFKAEKKEKPQAETKSNPEAKPQAETETDPKSDPQADAETEAKAKTLIDSAMEIINKALGAIGDKIIAVGDWVNPKVQAFKTKIGGAIGALGEKATTAYSGVTGAFSVAITKAKEAVKDYKEDPAAFKAQLKKNIGTMANTALENIKSAPGKAMDAVAGGVSAAMAAISSFLNNLAFPEDTDKSLGENVQAQLVAMVGKLNLPPEMKNKILRTIQGANLADAEKLMRTELTNQPTKRTSDVYLKPGSASRTDIPGKQYNTKQLKKWKELKELTRKFDKEMQAKKTGLL